MDDDLRQILRYEIPGLIAILYFLALSHPVLLAAYKNQFTVFFEECAIGNVLLGFSAVIVALALPTGLLLYEFYLFIEHENHLSNKEALNVVTKILKWYHLSDEEKWWSENGKDTAVRNELLDTIFFNKESKENKMGVIDLLLRFQHYYHSRRVIGIYAPLSAALATEILHILYFRFFSMRAVIFIFIILFLIFILKIKSVWEYLDNRSKIPYGLLYCFIVGIPIILSLLSSSFPQEKAEFLKIIVILLTIIAISLIMILPTRKKGGYLRNEIDELEKNILLLRKKDVARIICERYNFEADDMMKPTNDTERTESINCDNLRLEYEEIGSNMRMYGTLRRQEVTMLLVFTGALLAAIAQFKDFEMHFSMFGIIIALFFLVMMKRLTEYYFLSRERAIQIEKLLEMRQFQFLEEELKKTKLHQLTSTMTTYFICMTIILLWICILLV